MLTTGRIVPGRSVMLRCRPGRYTWPPILRNRGPPPRQRSSAPRADVLVLSELLLLEVPRGHLGMLQMPAAHLPTFEQATAQSWMALCSSRTNLRSTSQNSAVAVKMGT